MRTTLRVFSCVLPWALLLVAGCGGDRATDTGPDGEAGAARREAPVYGATGAEILRVVPVEIEVPEIPPGWSGMRIAAISDLHLGQWEGNTATARAAMERAAAERPDLVVLLGDYVVSGGQYELLDQVLAPLRGLRVLAVLGDRDMAERSEGPDSAQIRVREALTRNGVEVLMNARARVSRGGDTAFVAGIDPFTARRPAWRQAEIWGGIPGGPETVVVLSHMPVASVTMPTGKYPVLLGGHTFCGQVEVPGTPRLRWVNTQIFPGTTEPDRTRIYRIRGATVFITCGVGFGYVPVRFGAPPEVALITLRAVGGAEAEAEETERPESVEIDSLIRQFSPADTTGTADTAAEAEPA